MKLEISVVDREDIKATAWKRNGWIEIYLRNETGIPITLLQPSEVIALVIVPAHRENSEDELRQKLLVEANSRLRQRYDVE